MDWIHAITYCQVLTWPITEKAQCVDFRLWPTEHLSFHPLVRNTMVQHGRIWRRATAYWTFKLRFILFFSYLQKKSINRAIIPSLQISFLMSFFYWRHFFCELFCTVICSFDNVSSFWTTVVIYGTDSKRKIRIWVHRQYLVS